MYDTWGPKRALAGLLLRAHRLIYPSAYVRSYVERVTGGPLDSGHARGLVLMTAGTLLRSTLEDRREESGA